MRADGLLAELYRRVDAARVAHHAAVYAAAEPASDRLTDALAELVDLLGEPQAAEDPVTLAVVRELLGSPQTAPPGPVPPPATTAGRVVTAHEAAIVLHHYGLGGGYPGSGFTAGLVALMASADWENLGRLALGFPGYATAVRLAGAGEARLRDAAAGASVRVGFWCPRCLRVSFAPMDLIEGYCGHCHAWTAPVREDGGAS
ncbi:MAG: hypothetical protein ACRDTE_13510 [Pseudonocardiaceae bacterium]